MQTKKRQRSAMYTTEILRGYIKSLDRTLEPIESEEDFFRMYDRLILDKSHFAQLRWQLLAAWKRAQKGEVQELYRLQIKETDTLYENRELHAALAHYIGADPTFPWIDLPVLCWRDDGDACVVLWTAPSARRLGLATDIVNRLKISRVYDPPSSSVTFWNRLRIDGVDKLPGSGQLL